MSESSGKTLDPGLRRNLVIIGGVLIGAILLVLLVILLRPSSQQAGQASAALPKTPGTGIEKEGPMSPAMQQLLREKQFAEAEEARRRGRSYIPPDTAAAEPLPSAAGPGLSQSQQFVAPAPANVQMNPQLQDELRARRERLSKGIESQLGDLVAATAPAQTVARVVFASPAAAAGSAPAGEAARAGASAKPDPGNLLVDALEIFAGSTASPVDTYKTGYISARISSGVLAGAFLTGRTQLVNEGLQPRFSAMRVNGRTYKINAIALDEQTATDAVDADLDRRYLQRYVMPVLMAAVGGYATARAQTGSTVVGIGNGSEAVATPSPTEKQAVNAGIASAATLAQRAIEADASLPIRAMFPAGSAIGIMFLEPVVDLDSDPALVKATGEQVVRDRSAAAAAAPSRGGLSASASPTYIQTQPPQPGQPGFVPYGSQPQGLAASPASPQ